MKIVLVPQPILATPVKQVKKVNQAIKALVADMMKTLEQQHDPEGVGLAANQVGQSLALFIMKPEPDSPITVCINPEVIKLINAPHNKEDNPKKTTKGKRNKKTALEGCLSIPGLWGHVDRSGKVLLRFLDLDGKQQEKWFLGFKAAIIQHEMDHLNGIVFTQRALEQGHILYKEKDGEFEKYEI
ncbi:peptide deformylase [Candidatus Roizmanbacteria bacterium RIFCSPHIGHO2_02_FULL_40_9]|uniref:Peptide deformylase n=1 Tax=Candidatus Roizmanbacteria bacterium RIFCSPHIGHO2_02_FULL_40_9 TaxID=1802042 RepID=A0A1F7HC65_9BACT|nr:MAG: peptide deformylase [Candidatus Roizmanbacteria bacterium RIFCSPHIGHO2_02_FULL_40_9]